MILAIISFSMRHRLGVLLGTFALAALGVFAMRSTPIDALPDLSENQILVFTEWPGRSPHEVEDQITQPLSTSLTGLAGVRTVRAASEFGYSLIHVIFDDSVDYYFARARVGERLQIAGARLPSGSTPSLAPDATALGQIFWYTIEGENVDLAERRAIQDFEVRPALAAVEGVAEVATAGGVPTEYQIDLDPSRLLALDVSLSQITTAIERSNSAVGGNSIASDSGAIRVRGVSWVRSIADLESIPIADRSGTPLQLRDVAHVQLGPGFRRGVLERNGAETVGGVVSMRVGEDPLSVTQRIHAKIDEIAKSLRSGVSIVPFYERTRLIESATTSLRDTLLEEILVASIAVLLILAHARSTLLVCATVPLAILVSFIAMRALSIPSNIMSLSGIAISIGVLIDAAIVMTENAHHRLAEEFRDRPVSGDTTPTILRACETVGRPLFFSVLIAALPFTFVLALHGTEGKLFHPLAWTKLFAFLGVGLLAITLVPALLPTVLRGRLSAAEDNWIVRSVAAVYRPLLSFCLRSPDLLLVVTGILVIVPAALAPRTFPYTIVAAVLPFCAVLPIAWFARRKLTCAALVLALGAGAAALVRPLGEEFMPRLDEGTIVDMPVTSPTISIDRARADLIARDALLRSFPEVSLVVGKAGRAETATDPSPLNMIETIVDLRPREQWLHRKISLEDALDEAERVLDSIAALDPSIATNGATRNVDRTAAATRAIDRFDDYARDLSSRRLAAARDDAEVRATIAKLDQELVEIGAPRFVEMLAQELLAAARPGPVDSTLATKIANERGGPFARRVLFQRKDAADLHEEFDRVVSIPGWGNIWTAPIVNRIDMLATGIRTPVGIKVFGDDRTSTESTLAKLSEWTRRIVSVVRRVDGASEVFGDPTDGNSYLEITIDRERAARAGVAATDIDDAIETAIGGRSVGTTVEGRRRFAIRVRYARDFIADTESLGRVLVHPSLASDSPADAVGIPLSAVATLRLEPGPSMIASENGALLRVISASVKDRDLLGFVDEARREVEANVPLPAGFRVEWSGEYEQQVHARDTLQFVVPAVLLLVLLLLHLTYRDAAFTGIMALAVPGAIAGGALFQWLCSIPFSVAVAVGYISCFGMATGTAIVMLVYLREAVERRGGIHAMKSDSSLAEAVLEGAVKRLRPKLLTESTMILGLAPLIFATGVGSEILKPMAAPILGGILVADEVIDLLVPVLFYAVMRRRRWPA